MTQVIANAPKLPTYVVITPARNEREFIEATIQSVVAQSVRPLKWVIVSDGSTDGTDRIVERYAALHEWIELLRAPERRERHFAGKVMAFNAGLARMEGLAYQVIANLDADITFDSGYFAFLLGKLTEDSALGVVGTPYREITSETYNYEFVSANHVSGACQVFRRACFEQIGGYIAAKGGAIDTIATLTARMKGWKTRTFTEKLCVHNRVIGSAQSGRVKARFELGKRDYAIGNHPAWEICRCLYQMSRPPIAIRGLALMAGYLRAAAAHQPRPISRELIAFLRKEQMERLGEFLKRNAQRLRSVPDKSTEGAN